MTVDISLIQNTISECCELLRNPGNSAHGCVTPSDVIATYIATERDWDDVLDVPSKIQHLCLSVTFADIYNIVRLCNGPVHLKVLSSCKSWC